MEPLKVILLIVILNVFLQGSSCVCIPYQGNVCTAFISQDGVALDESNQQLIEVVLESLGWSNITKIANVLAPDCSHHAQAFVCNYFFPPCSDSGEPIKICKQTCQNFQGLCSVFLNTSAAQEITGYLPDCNTFQDFNCTTLDFVPPLDYSSIVCPEPLIRNPDPSKVIETCPGGYCCLSCPFVFNFYPPNQIEFHDKFFIITSIIFSFFALATLIGYLCLPSKRRFPHTLIIFLICGILISYLPTWIVLFGGNDIKCNSLVEQGDFSNVGCVFQGNFLIYGIYTTFLSFVSIQVNVFLLVLFGIEDYTIAPIIYPIFVWGLPLIPIIVLNANHGFGFGYFVSLCGANSFQLIDKTVIIPLAVLVFPTFLLSLATFFKLFLIARVSKNAVQIILRIQGRSLFFSFFGNLVFLGYIIYTRTLQKEIPDDLIINWFICIASGNGQGFCSNLFVKYLPSLASTTTLFFFVSLLGVLCFFVFLFKKDIKAGWKDLLLESKLEPFLKKMKLLDESTISDYYEPRTKNETQMDEVE